MSPSTYSTEETITHSEVADWNQYHGRPRDPSSFAPHDGTIDRGGASLHIPFLTLESHDSILEELNNPQELPTSSSAFVPTPTLAERRQAWAQFNAGRAIRCDRSPYTYNDWCKSQPDMVLQLLMKKLFELLNITGKTKEEVKIRSKWSRRFRLRADEEMKEDLESDDPIRHQKVIDKLSIRQNAKLSNFKIGELREISKKLNKYWRIDEEKAYNRFIKQARRQPHLVPMSRVDDEVMIKQVAELMTPRRYLVGGQQRKSRERNDESRLSPAAAPLDETATSSLQDTSYDLPFIDP